MDSVHEENGVCHLCFPMKKQAVHKDSFSSLILWSIVVLRLRMCCITVSIVPEQLWECWRLCVVSRWLVLDFCSFFAFFFCFIFLFFRRELCLQQVLFPPQEVLHPSHSQEQHLGWWVSCYTALLPSPRPLLTRCWFAAPSRCRGAHDAPTAGHVRAADDEAPLWSRHWPWCTGEPCCHVNVLLLSTSLESSLCVCIVSAQL